MKASSATSAKAETVPPRPIGRSSAPHTLTSAEGFALSGPSDLPDPARHAYRQDLADAALAGRVIASHYAEPLDRRVTRRCKLFADRSGEGEALVELKPGEPFAMLDNSLGWAWGYAGKDRRVGYVPADCVGT